MVFYRQERPKIQGHQRGLCLQGDPARIRITAHIQQKGGQGFMVNPDHHSHYSFGRPDARN
jgi:hypothetical protein